MESSRLKTTLQKMRSYAAEHKVPIMEEEGMALLLSHLQEQKPGRILEIGAAIGYSALRMAEVLPDCSIDTIERDGERAELARKFIEEAACGQRVTVFEGDALEVDLAELCSEYDAVFIDAAKGQYGRFFDKYSPLLPEGGMLYCDNIQMHGLAELPLEQVPRRKRTMIRNLKEFKERMINHPSFETKLISAGDGLMICKKEVSS